MHKTYTIQKMSPTGHGIAFDESTQKEVSILGAFPGDKVLTEMYKTIGDTHYAKILHIEKASPDRIHTPNEAPFFDANAPWKHLSQEAENRYKKSFIEELYGNDFPKGEIEIAPLESETGYRNKVAYTFLDTSRGLRFALYTRGEKVARKVEQQENILAHPRIEKLGKQFLHFFNQKNIKAEQLKYLTLRYSFYEDALVAYLLVPETNRKKLPFKKSELGEFLAKQESLKGTLVAHSPADVRSALSEKAFYALGDIEVQEKMLDKLYSYHPSLFFQINPISFQEILKDLRAYIRENVPQSTTLHALDLFAGVGIIGIELADLFHTTKGVELSALSKEYAFRNAKANQIEHFNFEEAHVNDALNLIVEHDVLIIDPPRSGLHKKTREAIRKHAPQYIFYISCNPQTQYRDFAELRNHYTIEKVKMYNLFPKTHHIESLIILKRK